MAWAHPALAEPTAAEKERARELMAQGREHRDVAKDLPAALKSFQGANDIMHVPTTAFEVARTQQALNLFVEAHETIVALRALPSSPSDPAQFGEARAKAEALDRELLTQMASLKIVVTSSDPKATPSVSIDDQPVPSLDTPRKLNPGKHVVVARAGGAEASASVQLTTGETKQVDLRLDAKSSTSTTGPTPTTPDESRPIPLITYVGFGVGAVGLAVGSVTGILAFSKEGDLADKCTDKACKPELEGDLDSANTMALISTVGFIVAGVGAAVGVVGLLTRPSAANATITTGTAAPPSNRLKVRFAGNGLTGTF